MSSEEFVFSCEATCVAVARKDGNIPTAIRVVMRVGPWTANQWVPMSAVHDDSEVFVENTSGKLVLRGWFATERGLIAPPAQVVRSKDLSGRFSPSTASMIVDIIENAARARVSETREYETLCLCDSCADVDGHHASRHEAEALAEIACLIRDTLR
jgi:hypothetical protein